jgi:hypothetical protein
VIFPLSSRGRIVEGRDRLGGRGGPLEGVWVVQGRTAESRGTVCLRGRGTCDGLCIRVPIWRWLGYVLRRGTSCPGPRCLRIYPRRKRRSMNCPNITSHPHN